MKIKGLFLYVLIVFCSAQVTCTANIGTKDSLLTVLKSEQPNNLSRRIELLSHLSMVCAGSGDISYAKRLYDEAAKAKDEQGVRIAFNLLLDYYLSTGNDSLSLYIERARKDLTGEMREGVVPYAEMKLRIFGMLMNGQGQNEAHIDSLRQILQGSHEGFSDFEEASWNLLLGQTLLIHRGNHVNGLEAVPYFEKGIEIARKHAIDLAFPFLCTARLGVINLYMENADLCSKSVAQLDTLMSELDELQVYYKDYPFYKIPLYRAQLYGVYLAMPQVIGEKRAQEYLKQYSETLNKMDDSPSAYMLRDTYYVTVAYYYQRTGDWTHAIEMVDKAIESARTLGMPHQLPERLIWKAQTLKMAGRMNDAVDTYEEYAEVSDSIFNASTQEKVTELQSSFGYQKMRAEKAEMQIEKQQTAFILLIVILVLLVVVLFYRQVLHKKIKKEVGLKSDLLSAEAKALESERMKTAFTQSVVRELRTPLNTISGASELILDGQTGEKERETLKTMLRENIDRLDHLIDFMLEVSELDGSQDKQDVPMELSNVYDLCELELNSISKKARNPNIERRLELPREEKGLVLLHKRYFLMMIYQLIDNVYKFTDKGILTIQGEIRGKELKVCLSDTGKGIPVDKQEWVFERFAKLDAYSQGMGMGLYLCKLITKRLGGEIWIDSSYTEGTKVCFTLPCDPVIS